MRGMRYIELVFVLHLARIDMAGNIDGGRGGESRDPVQRELQCGVGRNKGLERSLMVVVHTVVAGHATTMFRRARGRGAGSKYLEASTKVVGAIEIRGRRQ